MSLKCKPDALGNPVIPGMKVSLMPHQVHGVKWMVDKENKPELGRKVEIEDKSKRYGKAAMVSTVGGGLLGDEMGLGKTIQSIAMMVHNRSQETDPVKVDSPLMVLRQTTLIIAPLALIHQWKREIERRTKRGLFRVHIHHGKEALTSRAEFLQYDIIITTYGTMMQGYRIPVRKCALIQSEQ
jgi:SNF2 family DNA or RNA helicase